DYLWQDSSASTITTSNTNNCGTFTALFTINLQPYGTTTILARDMGYKFAENIFGIQPEVWVIPSSGTVGSSVMIKGNGYGKNTSLQINFGTTNNVGDAFTTDTNGSFTTFFTINTQKWGTTTFTILGSGVSDATIFNIEAAITNVSPNQGTVGTSILIDGNGFVQGPIKLDLGNMEWINAGFVSDNKGVFSTSFVLNSQPYGTKTVIAKHGTGQIYSSYPRTFFILPNIDITPGTGTVTTIVTVSGTGYNPLEVIRIGFGSTITIVTAQGSSLIDISLTERQVGGTFSITFVVNTQPAGTRTVTGYGTVIGTESTEIFTIIPSLYSVDPAAGTVGSQVTIAGRGYGDNERVDINFGITSTITFCSSNGNGWFYKSFTIDTQPYATTTIQAICTTSGWGTGVINTCFIMPAIFSVSPSKGTVGTLVTIKGNGFGDTKKIRIAFGTNPSISTIYSDSSGSFTSSFTIDIQSKGITTITATGLVTGATATNTFEITAELIITPMSGTVGTLVVVNGQGFGATEAIR
ncbi:MAG: hypothetical protein AAB296_02875, partial [Candidatus Desantisbacteria bacterium]